MPLFFKTVTKIGLGVFHKGCHAMTICNHNVTLTEVFIN